MADSSRFQPAAAQHHQPALLALRQRIDALDRNCWNC
jgi:hypothetical protein